MTKKQVENDKSKYINDLWDDYKYSISQYDSQVLYISSGALALSLTFLKDIVPLEKAECFYLYLFALILFTICISLGVYCHYQSFKLIEKQIKNVSNDIFNTKPDKTIPILNLIIGISLILGILSLVIFSSVNLYNMNNKKENPTNTVSNPSKPDTIKGLTVRPMPSSITTDSTTNINNPKMK